DLRTSVKEDGEDYLINGQKVFVTHSRDASLFLVYFRFAPGLDGIVSIIVERDAPGFTVGEPSQFRARLRGLREIGRGRSRASH
ncbi:acyl-CoA dehydrogenase family protein, partial [Rhizobium johnstonii]|uniref:acyl-CoA dehydrogenase family protein n=1 Tax=Rhizobium johnstonii TaxID=3019933 RepID=UPI003F9AB298